MFKKRRIFFLLVRELPYCLFLHEKVIVFIDKKIKQNYRECFEKDELFSTLIFKWIISKKEFNTQQILITSKFFIVHYKNSKFPLEIISKYQNFLACCPKTTNEIIETKNKISHPTEFILLIDYITNFINLHIEIDKEAFKRSIKPLLNHFINFSHQKKLSDDFNSNIFFEMKFQGNKFFNPYFKKSDTIYILQTMKQLNKLYKNQIINEFLPISFLNTEMLFLSEFMHSLKISKLSFELKKKEKINTELREHINFYYKSMFKHIFNKFISFLCCDEDKQIEMKDEILWDYLLRTIIFFEIFNLNHCNLLIFQAIIENSHKYPEKYSYIFCNLKRFSNFFSDNFNFVYISERNIVALTNKKKVSKEIVKNLSIFHYFSFFILV